MPQRTLTRRSPARLRTQFRETGAGPYDAELTQAGVTPRVELDEVGPVDPPAEAIERLQLGPGDRALIRRRRMYADDQPAQLATSYVPWSLAEGTQMTEPDTGLGGLYSRLAELGHAPIRFKEEVSARLPERHESEFLGIPASQPVLSIVRTAFEESGRVVETCEQVVGAASWLLVYEFQAD